MQNTYPKTNTQAWWKNSYVWLIIAGPALVIIASCITVYLVAMHPDPAIENYYQKGIQINKTLANDHTDKLTPALIARNHVVNNKSSIINKD